MIKKILLLILCLMMLPLGSAFASEIDFTAAADNKEGNINISGTAPADWGSRNVAIMVVRPENNEAGIIHSSLTFDTEADFKKSVYTIKKVECEDDGTFSTTIKFSDNAPSGYYWIRVGATGLENDAQNYTTVLYVPKAVAEGVLGELNGKTSGIAIRSVIDGQTNGMNNYEILSLDTGNAMYGDEVCNYLYVLKGEKYENVELLQLAYEKSCALAEINKDVTKIEDYASLLNIDISSAEYTANKAAVATLVKNNFSKLPEYKTQPEKFFRAMTAVAAINTANRENVMGIVESYAATLDITLSEEYSTLSSYEVGKALVGKNFTDVKGVQDALSARISELISQKDDDDNDDGGGNSGGGRGPSAGGITTQEPIKPIEEVVSSTKEAFTDVSTSHWAYEAITKLSKKEIINGIGDGVFNPDGSVTREQIAKMVVLTFGINTSEENSFDDVEKNSWYAPFVAAALESGIVNGIGEGSFGVGLMVTRQDLMVMLNRALVNNGFKLTKADTESFSDSDMISDYAKEAVSNLYGSGIVSGNNGKVEPKKVCSRAEAAKLIYETMKKIEARTEAGIYEN